MEAGSFSFSDVFNDCAPKPLSSKHIIRSDNQEKKPGISCFIKQVLNKTEKG